MLKHLVVKFRDTSSRKQIEEALASVKQIKGVVEVKPTDNISSTFSISVEGTACKQNCILCKIGDFNAVQYVQLTNT
ncbi:MAG TPA: hypothetical protein PKI93_05140 [Alphaproteobacteria bacterium]|nr:hypothetical protein [Alphaproteobacteria bacterium]HNS44200.1 hypothetical protein [Alphaproteobacteria bacterium]